MQEVLSRATKIATRQRGHRPSTGRVVPAFTLIEIVVSLALAGLITMIMLGSFRDSTRIERFTGGMKLIAADLADRRVDATTVLTGDCTGWFCRGFVIEVQEQSGGSPGSYEVYQLYGDDSTRFSSQSQQQGGLRGKQLIDSVDLSDYNLEITDITVNGEPPTNRASIALFSPDGTTYTDGHIVNSYNPNSTGIYSGTGTVRINFQDVAHGFEGHIDYNPISGEVSTRMPLQ